MGFFLNWSSTKGGGWSTCTGWGGTGHLAGLGQPQLGPKGTSRNEAGTEMSVLPSSRTKFGGEGQMVADEHVEEHFSGKNKNTSFVRLFRNIDVCHHGILGV